MRYKYLDALRSVLMILGVFYHAALIYKPGGSWRVADHGEPLFGLIQRTLHTFRLPAFFIIAGFFTLFSLRRHGLGTFLANRAQRLLIPFLASLLILNSFQFYLTDGQKTLARKGWDGLIEKVAQAHLAGDTVSHLWFLTHLFVYALMLVAGLLLFPDVNLRPAWRERAARWGRALCDGGLLFALLPLSSVAVKVIQVKARWVSQIDLPGLRGDYLLVHLPFFLFGLLCYQSQAVRESLFRIRKWHLALLAGALVAMEHLPNGRSLALPVLASAYCNGVWTWSLCIGCFWLFRRYLDGPSPLFAYLSDASYSIYLFHHVIVIACGQLLLPFGISSYLKYPIVVTASIGVSLAIHHTLILNSKVLRLMFNGKYEKGLKRRKEPGQVPARPDGAMKAAASGPAE